MKIRKWKAEDFNDFCKYILPILLLLWSFVFCFTIGLLLDIAVLGIASLIILCILGWNSEELISGIRKTRLMEIFED